MCKDASAQEIDEVMNQAWTAFYQYRKMSLKSRHHFMRAIGKELENHSEDLVKTAMEETNLPKERLKGELDRTVFQLNQYGAAAERGDWLEARIDTAKKDKNMSRQDIRKMLVPLGPVVVFGASNFPFAYSTAGGDTACALAAGCPVVVKAHPAHARTSERVAEAILAAAELCKMPAGIFAHVHGASIEVGKALVMHEHTKAVGFTGSLAGGKQLFDWGNQRKIPIPVFSEMGSINPVFLLPDKLKTSCDEIVKMYADSITRSVGQFCTNPGLIIGIENDDLEKFICNLGEEIKKIPPHKMLHAGIAKSFEDKKNAALRQQNVKAVAVSEIQDEIREGVAAIATAAAKDFLSNPVLHQEVFGPYSLVIRCSDREEMIEVAKNLEGQLTSTILGSDTDLSSNSELIEQVTNICGRLIINSVPTGVTVCLSMQHGGPFPATTDSRFTSVGADGIKRFARPVCFQHWPDKFLPDALKNNNPLHLWRTVNDQLTQGEIE